MEQKKNRRSAPGPLGNFCIVSYKNSVSFYFVEKIRKLPSILYDNPAVGDTQSPLGIVPFYIRNLFKIHLEQKKSSSKY